MDFNPTPATQPQSENLSSCPEPHCTGGAGPLQALVGLLDECAAKRYRNPVRRESAMPKETTYTQARANLASLCNDVATTREAVIIHRRGANDVALVAADELDSLIETAHLLRSPKNARRLLTALQHARTKKLKPQTVGNLRRDFGLDKEA